MSRPRHRDVRAQRQARELERRFSSGFPLTEEEEDEEPLPLPDPWGYTPEENRTVVGPFDCAAP